MSILNGMRDILVCPKSRCIENCQWCQDGIMLLVDFFDVCILHALWANVTCSRMEHDFFTLHFFSVCVESLHVTAVQTLCILVVSLLKYSGAVSFHVFCRTSHRCDWLVGHFVNLADKHLKLRFICP